MLRIIATTCVLGLLAAPTAMAGQADLIPVGAKALTGNSHQPAAEAVALAGGTNAAGVHVTRLLMTT